MNTLKTIFSVIGTIVICIIFPPVIIVLLIYGVYMLLSSKKGDINHVGGKEWININNAVIQDPNNQKIFNDLKALLFDRKETLVEAYNDGCIEKEECNKILKDTTDYINNSKKCNSSDEKYIMALSLEALITFPSAHIPEGLILNPREDLYFYTKTAAIDTIKRVRTDISYNGFRTTQGGFRLGNISVSSNSVEGIKRFDAGLLAVTNQRIIFKGVNNHTKTITFGSIIGIEKFEDNGVIIFLSNRETPVIIRFIADKYFFHNVKMDGVVFHNDLVWFERAISEILKARQ